MPAGIIPFLPAIFQGVVGGMQALGANKKSKERAFEQELAKMPVYGGAPEIARNYQQALQRANVGLGNLESTKYAEREQARSLNNILSYAASRPGGQGLLSKLYEQQNLGKQRIYAGAEAEKNRRMAELSRAAQMQAADLGKIYASKREKQGMLTSAKQQEAVAAGQQLLSGLSNVSSAAMNAGRIFAAKYGTGSTGSTGGTRSRGTKGYYPNEFGEKNIDEYGNSIG